MTKEIEELTKRVKKFGEERGWLKYHSPKNLSMAISIEAAELLEHFQWLTEDESCNISAEKKLAAGYEIADVVMYSLLMADKIGVDLSELIRQKIDINEKRFNR